MHYLERAERWMFDGYCFCLWEKDLQFGIDFQFSSQHCLGVGGFGGVLFGKVLLEALSAISY
jgi:hypothetical protein